ncbi:MAG: MarC family protein [Ruaniaceae bacterium]|nr:MarC family protein [Ruaniaceae bacterium]
MNQYVDITLLASTFLTLFVIMDPPGLLPIFLSLTDTMTRDERKKAAIQATATSFGVITAFILFGRFILDFLHISLPALQLSGGLLLLIMAMELLMGRTGDTGSRTQVNVALVPLGTPLIAGPGAIVAGMLAGQQAWDVEGGPIAGWIAVVGAVVLMHVVLWMTMRFAGYLFGVLGEGGVSLLTRIAGLLLAAIAVQLMADAVFAFIDAAF